MQNGLCMTGSGNVAVCSRVSFIFLPCAHRSSAKSGLPSGNTASIPFPPSASDHNKHQTGNVTSDSITLTMSDDDTPAPEPHPLLQPHPYSQQHPHPPHQNVPFPPSHAPRGTPIPFNGRTAHRPPPPPPFSASHNPQQLPLTTSADDQTAYNPLFDTASVGSAATSDSSPIRPHPPPTHQQSMGTRHSTGFHVHSLSDVPCPPSKSEGVPHLAAPPTNKDQLKWSQQVR